MEFTINQKELKDALTFVCSVAGKKTTIPVLQNVLIEGQTGNVRFTGSDLDILAIADITVPVSLDESICVSAHGLLNIVKNLSGDIDFDLAGEWLEITSGAVRYKLATVEAVQFPELPDLPLANISLPAVNGLDYLVKHTELVPTKDPSRFSLDGIKLEIKDGFARTIATDGHRLALVDITGVDGEMDALVPLKAMKAAAKMGTVAVGADSRHVRFVNCTKQVIARKLTGQFPNYEMVFPKNNFNVVEIDAEKLAWAVKQASLTVDKGNESRPIKLKMSKDSLTVVSSSIDNGDSEISLPITYDGEYAILGFNYQYLLDALKPVKGNVTFSFENSNIQVEISHNRVRNIIMPLGE